MGLESATHIQDFVTTNPTGSDQKAQGDDHIRMIKDVLKRDFPDVTGIVRLLGWNAKTDAVVAKTAGYTLAAADDGKFFPFTIASAQQLTLPSSSAVANNGFVAWVRKDNSENLLTIASGIGETVNGLASIVLGANDSGMLWCDGTNWHYVGSSVTEFTQERTIRRSTNDATLQDGLILERTRSGTAADNDFGASVVAKHQDDAGNRDVVGRLGWRMLDTGNGSEDMAWFFENIIAGAIATADRLWKGQGLYADGLTDPGQKGANFSRFDVANSQIFPLTALAQMTAALLANDDRVLVRDTSAGDHKYLEISDLSAVRFLAEIQASASATLDINLETWGTRFTHFRLIGSHIVPSVDGDDLFMRVASDTVPTPDAGASDYGWVGLGENSALLADVDNADSEIQLNDVTSGLGTGAGEYFSFDMMIYDPTNALVHTQFAWQSVSRNLTPHITTYNGAAQRFAAQDTTFLRFFMSSGNIASGKFRLYGVR